MNAIKNRLDLLEAKLQTLIEGGAARLFPTAISNDLAARLVSAIRAGVENSPPGETIVPHRFVLQANPQDAQFLQTTLDELSRLIVQAGLEAGLVFHAQPVVSISPDRDLAPGVLKVLAGDQGGAPSQTAAMLVTEAPQQATPAPDAHLVVDGTRIFHLGEIVTNIGRQNDNHLVINDRRVSRRHAQVRVVRGRHIIFDLDSAGGTWVNGQRVHQHLLGPGDMISLSGLPLIYKINSSGRGCTRDLDAGGGEG